MKLPPLVSFRRASTTGWRPPRISMQGSGTNSGSHQFSVSERSASAHSASSAAMARASSVSAGTWPAARRAALVEPLLAGQRALLRAQGLVFKGLELGRDEALGVLQRLAAAVVVGHLVELALRDLDVEAVHLVELHPQVGNAGARAFAGFQVEQEAVAVGLDGAQFVQFGVEAVAITPPSRTSAAGSGSRARCSSSAQPGGGCRSAAMRCSRAGGVPVLAARLCRACTSPVGCGGPAWPRPTSSRGRTWRSAVRAVMRSTSLRP
jgi:hypothetical protein